MKRIIPLWLIIFVSFFCYSSMLTMYVPLIKQELILGNYSQNLCSNLEILSGIFLALYPLGQFLGSPIIGALSDKAGRKKMLGISLITTLVCFLVMAFAIQIHSLTLLAIASFIAGFGESNMALALSAIADFSLDHQREKEFARAFVMCSLGYILGSLFGGLASFIAYTWLFLIEALLILITFIITIFWFSDTKQQHTNQGIRDMCLNFFKIFKKNPIRGYYLTNFLTYLAWFGILRVELIYMQAYFNLSQAQIAFYYSLASIVAMFGNFVITPILLKRLNLISIVLLTGVLSALSGILFILPTTTEFLWLTTSLIGLFVPINVAMIGALISKQAPNNTQGSVMGNNQSLQVLAEAISATLGGILFSLANVTPFILFVILGLIGVYTYNRLDRLSYLKST